MGTTSSNAKEQQNKKQKMPSYCSFGVIQMEWMTPCVFTSSWNSRSASYSCSNCSYRVLILHLESTLCVSSFHVSWALNQRPKNLKTSSVKSDHPISLLTWAKRSLIIMENNIGLMKLPWGLPFSNYYFFFVRLIGGWQPTSRCITAIHWICLFFLILDSVGSKAF